MMIADGVHPAWYWVYGLVSLVAVVTLIVWTVRRLRDDAGSPVGPRRSTARRDLDERFARGDLTSDEYLEQIAALGEEA
jgi:putative membrane protein